jgi:hypothetical protein
VEKGPYRSPGRLTWPQPWESMDRERRGGIEKLQLALDTGGASDELPRSNEVGESGGCRIARRQIWR